MIGGAKSPGGKRFRLITAEGENNEDISDDVYDSNVYSMYNAEDFEAEMKEGMSSSGGGATGSASSGGMSSEYHTSEGSGVNEFVNKSSGSAGLWSTTLNLPAHLGSRASRSGGHHGISSEFDEIQGGLGLMRHQAIGNSSGGHSIPPQVRVRFSYLASTLLLSSATDFIIDILKCIILIISFVIINKNPDYPFKIPLILTVNFFSNPFLMIFLLLELRI